MNAIFYYKINVLNWESCHDGTHKLIHNCLKTNPNYALRLRLSLHIYGIYAFDIIYVKVHQFFDIFHILMQFVFE